MARMELQLAWILTACAAGAMAARAQTSAVLELPPPAALAAAFEGSDARSPRQLRSVAEAERFFGAEGAAEIARRVDFERQFLLLFAWRGSGQDRLQVSAVAESYPEQITFSYRPGMTRDLREHVRLFALRSNVQWTPPEDHRGRAPRTDRDGDRPVASPDGAPGAIPAGDAGGDEAAGRRMIEVRVQLPSPGWRIRIQEIVEVGNELWVISQTLPAPPDVMSPMVIVEGADRWAGAWPDRPLRHFVLDHPWAESGDAPPGYTFLRDRRDLPRAIHTGRRLHPAGR